MKSALSRDTGSLMRNPLQRAGTPIGATLMLVAFSACAQTDGSARSPANVKQLAQAQPSPQSAVAVFAGGCFWCMEPPYDKLPGVISTTSGYIGGTAANPTYEQVSAGGTGHRGRAGAI